MGDTEGPVTHYFIGVDPNIPDWLVKIMFLGEVEIAMRSDLKSRFVIMGFSTNGVI